MIYNPYLFMKSYQERLDEFNFILSNDMCANDIMKGWSNYLELVIEPVGWKAIWRISRVSCADYKINFPCTVIVIVEHIKIKDLSCLVTVSEVDDDSVHLPEKLAEVPLIELYPTKEQDSSTALEMFETANLIDSLRFFYHNLWMPWDLHLDDESSWIDTHLVGRLQLHFLVLELKVPEEFVDKMRRMVSEGRQTLERIEDLIDAESDFGLPNAQLLKLTELTNRLSQLGNDYKIYEKPHLLKALLERKHTCKDSAAVPTVVLSKTTTEGLRNICSQLPEDVKEMRILPTLQQALEESPSVFLCQGDHPFQELSSLNTGGNLSGLEPGVVLVGDISGEDCATVDLLKGRLSINLLTLQMDSSWLIVKVRPSAEMSMTDVLLQGSSRTDGVYVHPGATFIATRCTFSDCQTALVCEPNSTVTLTGCTFTSNRTAIQIKEGCNFSMTECTISNSSICGVKISHTLPVTIHSSKSIQIMNSIPLVKETDTYCISNVKDISFLQTTSSCHGDSLQTGHKTMDISL